ncbi:hypothetical protein J1N35_037984 [Gossypium stocksii]|uniref:Uncharacterized protein n=1 Tax=Gossypium stocksii TaxID=47602 RepID=A0A9D3UL10_9ROSI|nr:hypothetical protein J1N35_037984 [Gossypium stocksii]
METRGKAKKVDVKKTFKEVHWCTTGLESRQYQLKDQIVEALSDNMDAMQEVFNIVVGELIEKEDALKAIVLD